MQAEEQTLKVDNQKISIKLYSPQANSRKIALLFLHGWTGKPNESAASFIANNGFCSLTVIMRGHDGSDGDIKKIKTGDSLNDAVAAYDYLKNRIPSNTRIVAVGNSYGAYIAALLSNERDLAGLSLRVPAGYPDDILEFPKWGKGHEDPKVNTWRHQKIEWMDNKALVAVHNFKAEIQIIEAENDEFIPSQLIQNYINAFPDSKKVEYRLMKGWSHSIGGNQKVGDEFMRILLRWVTKIEARV